MPATPKNVAISENAAWTMLFAVAANSAEPIVNAAKTKKAIWMPSPFSMSDLRQERRDADGLALLLLLLVEPARLEVLDLFRRLGRLHLDRVAALVEVDDHVVARMSRQAVALAE